MLVRLQTVQGGGSVRGKEDYCRPPIPIRGMEGLRLLRDGWTVIALRRRVAARKSPSIIKAKTVFSGRIALPRLNSPIRYVPTWGYPSRTKGSLPAASPAAVSGGGARWRIPLRRRQGLANRLWSDLREYAPQRADARREREAVALDDIVKLLGKKDNAFRRLSFPTCARHRRLRNGIPMVRIHLPPAESSCELSVPLALDLNLQGLKGR